MRIGHAHTLAPFRSFRLAPLYAFFSGILVGLALNLFVSVLLADNLKRGEKMMLFGAASAFLFSAAGFFIVNWNLDIARDEWVAEGASQNPKLLLEPIEVRLRWLYFGLLIGLTGLIVGICLIAWR